MISWTDLRTCVRLLDMKKSALALSILTGVLGLGCAVGLAAVSAWLIARASQMPPVLDLAVATVAVRTLGIGKALFRYLNRLASHHVALYGMAGLRAHIYNTLADSPSDVVTSLRRGDLLARTGKDIDTVGDYVVRSLLPAWVAFFVCLLSVAIVGIYCPPAGLVLALCLFISGVLGPYLAMRGANESEKARISDRATLSSLSLTMLESASELRVSGAMHALNRARDKAEDAVFIHRDRAARPAAFAAALDPLAMGISVIAAIFFSAQQLAAGTLAPVEMAVVVLTPLAAFEATSAMPMAAIQLLRSSQAATRVAQLLNMASTEGKERDSENIKAQFSSAHNCPAIELNSLVLSWPHCPPISNTLSLKVKKGEKIAIVGPSGIGKTTLLATMSGLIPPAEGTVEIEGKDTAEIPHRLLSQHIVMTAEDAHIFGTTVLENIRVARKDVSEEEAIELLHRVKLGPWLQALPHGIHTLLDADATNISGGERRRLLLARSLASHAPILLLDEPGEHLDSHTADSLIRDLLHADSSRTIIVVTHRLSPLDQADRVILLDKKDGRAFIRAQGTHEELQHIDSYAWALAQEGAQL